MGPHVYRAIRVVQQAGSPPFYITTATAAQILEWCDVPRAKGDYMAGYQRSLDTSRTGDLADYIRQSPNNIVPGAVIIAVDSDYLKIDEDGNNQYILTVAEDTRSFEEKLAELWGGFTTRLDTEELSSAGISFSAGAAIETPTAESDAEPVESDSGSADSAPQDDDDLPSYDADVAEQLEDDELPGDNEESEEGSYPTSYLANLAGELTQAITDWNSVPSERQSAIRSFIEGVSKPGLIIDGQHRVFGAKDVSEFDVTLPIVLLPGLPTSEQVFQFYVLNSKARPLRPTELRRIVSTSLTNPEIEELYHRFRAAGVEAEEARWTLQLNNDPRSAFQGRIDFGFSEPGTIIPENVADQLVRGFMKMPKSRYKQLTTPLGEDWTDVEPRMQRFFWFWAAIKNEYAGAWADAERMADDRKKAQLFQKVALITLQTFILDNLVKALPFQPAGAEAPLKSQTRIEEVVKASLTYLPAEFFVKEWRMKQIDTSEGRKLLYAFMEQVSNNQGKLDGRMRLYKGA
jgi:hypothetical protein